MITVPYSDSGSLMKRLISWFTNDDGVDRLLMMSSWNKVFDRIVANNVIIPQTLSYSASFELTSARIVFASDSVRDPTITNRIFVMSDGNSVNNQLRKSKF
jgi:hypothetical protein